jgi:sRNA-binding regulator protein Hfq
MRYDHPITTKEIQMRYKHPITTKVINRELSTQGIVLKAIYDKLIEDYPIDSQVANTSKGNVKVALTSDPKAKAEIKEVVDFINGMRYTARMMKLDNNEVEKHITNIITEFVSFDIDPEWFISKPNRMVY